MAARTANGEGSSKFSAIASWAAIFPAVLGGVGILLFGVLTLGYAAFYGRLGVTPEAVGLTYANTLARSTGFVAVVALGAATAATLYARRRLLASANEIIAEAKQQTTPLDKRPAGAADPDAEEQRLREGISMWRASLAQAEHELAVARAARVRVVNAGGSDENIKESTAAVDRVAGALEEAKDHLARHEDKRRRLAIGLAAQSTVRGFARIDQVLRRIAWLVLGATVALVAVLALVIVPKADRVLDGEEVEPIGLPGLTILDVRAIPASVKAVGKAEDAPAIRDLEDRSLLFLGQSGSTLVLFDSRTDEAVHVPAPDVVLRVATPAQ